MKNLFKNPPKIRKHLITGLIYLTIFMVIYLAINWWRQPIMPKKSDYQVTDYQGQTIDLVKISNQKPTLIYFWGTWCGVCSVTSPKVNTLAKQGYSVVTIAVKSGDNHNNITHYANTDEIIS
ncbi:MAG: redoxin domain-containing protein, partial [Moraxellaceae bacterium]|nr:redoxin domain-containing protein [Moraxellaceae bacterium]